MLHRSAVQAAVSLGYLTDLTDRERPVRPTFFFRSIIFKVLFCLSASVSVSFRWRIIFDLKRKDKIHPTKPFILRM